MLVTPGDDAGHINQHTPFSWPGLLTYSLIYTDFLQSYDKHKQSNSAFYAITSLFPWQPYEAYLHFIDNNSTNYIKIVKKITYTLNTYYVPGISS